MVERTGSVTDGAGDRPRDVDGGGAPAGRRESPGRASTESGGRPRGWRSVDARAADERGAGNAGAGDRETGDRGIGDRGNSDLEVGDGTSDGPIGGREAGDREAGDRQAGDRNPGDRDAGVRDAGEREARDLGRADRAVDERRDDGRLADGLPAAEQAAGEHPAGGPSTGGSATGDSGSGLPAGPEHPDGGADFAHGIEDDVQPLQPGVDTGPGVPTGPQLRHLSSAEGQAALATLMRGSVLFAFDFDGTLAPIRPRPGDVHVSATLALRLEKLARVRPVAIVTGRRIDDVRGRLGFTPTWIVGNHGAEDEGDPEAALRAMQALDPLRRRLEARADGLQDAGVAVEDKGQSLALHFRTAPDRAVARALIDEVLAGFTPHLHVFGGKLVVNAVAADAPDKAVAVRRLLARSGAAHAFFAGDDVNDEPVFAAARPGWLTVRIGCDRRGTSAARFCIDGPHEMAVVLDRMLALADSSS